ncbi:MAG: S1 RNA-binding domain-containing protein, partial [Candidatus Eisenbacteria bacterium]|nr:S1 RNA-binding domain-containing protein [Candidatus Eisenbacteria bacterium]
RLPAEWEDLAHEIADACTETEVRSEAAEREMIRIKVLRWAEGHLGDVHAGHVTGVTSSGLFVELDAVPVDGFIPREGIDFPSRYVDGRLNLRMGRKRGSILPGDEVVVRLERVDLRQRWLDLALVEGPRGVGRVEGRRKGKRDQRSGGRRSGGRRRKQRRTSRRDRRGR